jgi:hypothetical protein
MRFGQVVKHNEHLCVDPLKSKQEYTLYIFQVLTSCKTQGAFVH